MTVIGIDPGAHGAIAILSEDGLLIEDTPYIKPAKGKGEYDFASMAHLFASVRNDGNAHVFLERVSARPGEGVVSAFSFGKGYGAWLGIIAAVGMPYTLVTPQVWKKAMGLPNSKERARIRAGQLFPANAQMFARVKDDGRAEAALIAEYGRRLKL